MTDKSVLWKTKTYLVGHMQYADGQDWRSYVEDQLSPLNITTFNPYKSCFTKDIDEGDSKRKEMETAMGCGGYDKVSNWMREIRTYDLNLVDRSDFIIAHIIPNVASWGSAEELVTAVRMKKPVFISMEGGKKNTPLWIMGMIPHHYVYDSVSEIVDMIKNIDSGNKEIDSDRWRLLRKELR